MLQYRVQLVWIVGLLNVRIVWVLSRIWTQQVTLFFFVAPMTSALSSSIKLLSNQHIFFFLEWPPPLSHPPITAIRLLQYHSYDCHPPPTPTRSQPSLILHFTIRWLL